MTITQDSSAPLIAVVGATGTQGGSVVNALAESDKPYRIRGFTRDATKPSARNLMARGVEIVVVSFVVENQVEVYKAFTGADVAFLMTNYWEHMDVDREINEGKLLIDAAKAAGVSRIVWSGLPSTAKLSGGKYVHVWYAEGKAAVTEYARQSGVPFVDVQAGAYGTSLLGNPVMLIKQNDGSRVMPWPVEPTFLVPFIDAAYDYGLFVRYVLELPVFPNGAKLVACSEKLEVGDVAQQLSEATGKKVLFQQLSWTPSKPWNEFGWVQDTSPLDLQRRTRTWAEFLQLNRVLDV
ncbi:NAD(P)-binding protein [Mycena polygramma]|nr:NAD(P)-binding protein [Mycena polygramma]